MNHTVGTATATNNTRTQRMAYQIGDFVMSNVAMAIYNVVRYHLQRDIIALQGFGTLGSFLSADMVMVGQVCFPVAMMGIYWLSGYYNNVHRKSLLQEATTSFMSTFVCMMLVYFVALINDAVIDHYRNYEILLALWAILLVFIYPIRLAITLSEKRRIARSLIEFPTLIIGCNDNAIKFADELDSLKPRLGYKVAGFVNNLGSNIAPDQIGGKPVYEFDKIENVCRQLGITDLIVVPQSNGIDNVLHTLNHLYPLNIPIKLLSNETDVFLSRGRLDTVYGTPLIDISSSNMTECETNLKRASDMVISTVALLLLLPFLAIIAIVIKTTSKGPVIFKQQRIGLHGKPFTIYKFRTMVVDAEQGGQPQLTSIDDKRITPVGHIMRKYRIDELPQFWNVLRGDMALVGPRPERQYFIDQIIERAPQYILLQQVRPGITSFGMVKYGYASSIESMVERMRYDLIYIENISFATDMKIMIYTIWTVVTGKGL